MPQRRNVRVEFLVDIQGNLFCENQTTRTKLMEPSQRKWYLTENTVYTIALRASFSIFYYLFTYYLFNSKD